MAKLNLDMTINCPDYGKIRIKKYLSINELINIKDLRCDPDTVFQEIIQKIISDNIPFDIAELSEKDIDYLTLELVKLNGVNSLYQKKRKSGKSRSAAFILALRESPKIKCLDRTTKSFASQLAIRFGELGSIEKAMKNYRISGLERIVKDYNGIHLQISKFNKGLSFISEMERSLSILTSGITWSEHLKDISLSINKSMEQLLPSISMTANIAQSYKNYIHDVTQCSASIAKVMKLIPNFVGMIREANHTFAGITKEITSITEPFRLSNLAILDSKEIVMGTHEYFAKVYVDPLSLPKVRLPKTLSIQKEYLISDKEDNEKILQIEANESILVTNTLINELVGKIRSGLKQDLRDEVNEVLNNYKPLLNRMNILANPPSFLSCLIQCTKLISKDHWKSYWKAEGKEYIPNPETLAKSHLSLFISGFFGGISFVGVEIKSGRGFIDLFVNFLEKIYIVEIKIIGTSWGIGWAESGIQQLGKYMDAYGENESYLVVLDGRKTDKGKQLEKEYILGNKKVNVITSRIYWK